MDKIILNGNIESRSSLRIGPENRAFRYGDGLFETMHVENGDIRFYEKHFDRLVQGMKALSLTIPDHFPNMRDYIAYFLKEQEFQTGTLRWQVWRKSGGKYTPQSLHAEDIIEYYPFHVPEEEVKLGICKNSMVNYSPVSRFKTSNALPYVLAGIEMKESEEFNDLILLNDRDQIAECIYSNIFWSNNKHWYTSSISTGCVEGVMRNHVIEVFRKNNTPFIEGEFGIEYFLDIQKAFITNSSGIHTVSILGEIRLSDYLNLPEELEILRIR